MKRLLFRLFVSIGSFVSLAQGGSSNQFTRPVKIVKHKVWHEPIKIINSVLKSEESLNHGAFFQLYKKDTVIKGNYNMGSKHGLWVYNDTHENYHQQGRFKNDIPVGLWKTDNYKGGKSLCYYNRDGVVDSVFNYNNRGELLSNYKKENNTKNSSCLLSCNLKRIKLETSSELKVSYKYLNGQLFYSCRYTKKQTEDGIALLLTSVSDYYRQDGSLVVKSDFNNGNGTLYRFHRAKLAEGVLLESAVLEYKNGLVHGGYYEYDTEGKLLLQGGTFKGYKLGFWEVWNEDKNDYVVENYQKKPTKLILKNEFHHHLYDESLPLNDVCFIGDSKKEVFKDYMSEFIDSNFKTKNLKKCFSDGEYSTDVLFDVNILGEITNVHVAPENEYVQAEFERIFKELPMTKPSNCLGVNVSQNYKLPFEFKITKGQTYLVDELPSNSTDYNYTTPIGF